MKLTFEIATMEHLDEIIPLYADSFGKREPMTASLHLTYEEITEYARTIFPYSINEQLTVVACDEEVKKIIGFVTGFKKELWEYEGLIDKLNDKILEGAEKTSKVFNRLLEPLNRIEGLTNENVMTALYLGVHKDYLRNHIAQNLLAQFEKLIINAGYRFLIGEYTTRVSEKFGVRNGGTVINAIAYKDFGIADFSATEGEISLVVKDLINPQLTFKN